ncbi:amidase [Tautonia sociabilis]|uniref:Amidase n=1 Tax=Tautonia sociabilis TaxID=2080755 RepID=A0A432MNR1_9BACT|nr:amidase [Tautonia sociabilis]RUL88746.1 amidase [Tautonia sociabilis]
MNHDGVRSVGAQDEASPPLPDAPGTVRRRAVLRALAALGIGSATFQRAMAALAQEEAEITPDRIAQAEWIAGLELTEEERESTARAVSRALEEFEELRGVEVGYDIPPALTFLPEPPRPSETARARRHRARPIEWHAPERPESDEDLAFLPVTELSALVRARTVSSRELTELYLERLKRFDPILHCVVTLTEDTARAQAEKADAELAAGIYRGPLHGIPWGAKDLISYPGYPTSWGAPPFKDQVLDEKATVAARLEEAGAVLVAKLSLGALAMGDRWFGGRTNSPWDPRRGSSGSSAGSAAAAAAGLVGFALGSETLGSIVSPCRACGASGLRPTFGRVSRLGCMPLSWSMDKVGPIARSLEDCALVLDAIHGADGRDPAAVDRPFDWPSPVELSSLRVGFLEDPERSDEDRPELEALRGLGVQLVPIRLPEDLPTRAVTMMLGTEAATVFDRLTRDHVTDGLNSWPTTFRRGQFVPAVEYLRASRVRTLLMRKMAELLTTVDLYVGHAEDLAITNLTGHPTAVLPFGFQDIDGREGPGSLTFTGRLYDESTLLALAVAFQRATGDHLRRPPLEQALAEAMEPEENVSPRGC